MKNLIYLLFVINMFSCNLQDNNISPNENYEKKLIAREESCNPTYNCNDLQIKLVKIWPTNDITTTTICCDPVLLYFDNYFKCKISNGTCFSHLSSVTLTAGTWKDFPGNAKTSDCGSINQPYLLKFYASWSNDRTIKYKIEFKIKQISTGVETTYFVCANNNPPLTCTSISNENNLASFQYTIDDNCNFIPVSSNCSTAYLADGTYTCDDGSGGGNQ